MHHAGGRHDPGWHSRSVSRCRGESLRLDKRAPLAKVAREIGELSLRAVHAYEEFGGTRCSCCAERKRPRGEVEVDNLALAVDDDLRRTHTVCRNSV